MVLYKQNTGSDPSLAGNKKLIQQLTAIGEQLNATNADFLKIDVETALTFSGLALQTDNREKRDRNRKNARKAYDSILRLWDGVTFTPSQEGYIHEMMSRLKDDLEFLGDKF
jgi:uncharacterized protein YicC (UPF0701 family)